MNPARIATVLLGLCNILPAFAAAERKPLPTEPVASIRVNSIGFLPHASKVATIEGGAEGAGFQILALPGDKVVFEGRLVRPSLPGWPAALQTADFSGAREAGQYVLAVDGVGRSPAFQVGTQIWREPYRAVSRAMYLWRCGVAVHGEWNGKTYEHAACHLHDALLDFVGGPAGAKRASTGGWHDAGDYNKYVVNAGVTVGLMFKAWEHFRPNIESVSFGIPESSNRQPDLLDELRFEFDWLFTMQAEDGSVYHKVSARDFSYGGVAEADQSPRYFVSWSSTATADFTAMMALGAQHFAEFDAEYAAKCLAAARRSWAFLLAHPGNHEADQSAFKTGGYGAPDPMHRLWAAIELYEATGEVAFLQDFERRARGVDWGFSGPSWYDVRELALGTYLTSRHPAARDAQLVEGLRFGLLGVCERIVAVSATDPHARPLGDSRGTWSWGGNGNCAAQTYLLHVADRLEPNPVYRATALNALAFLFGRNYHGRSYVTGLGANPPRFPHDRRGKDAWPGYLVGGPWPKGSDWSDLHADYRTNEIAINWNGALIYALAAFVEK